MVSGLHDTIKIFSRTQSVTLEGKIKYTLQQLSSLYLSLINIQLPGLRQNDSVQDIQIIPLTYIPTLTLISLIGPSLKRPKSYDANDDSMLCKRVVTKDRRYITQITCYEKGKDMAGLPDSERSSPRQAMRMPLFGKPGGGVLSSLFSKIGRQGTELASDSFPLFRVNISTSILNIINILLINIKKQKLEISCSYN